MTAFCGLSLFIRNTIFSLQSASFLPSELPAKFGIELSSPPSRRPVGFIRPSYVEDGFPDKLKCSQLSLFSLALPNTGILVV